MLVLGVPCVCLVVVLCDVLYSSCAGLLFVFVPLVFVSSVVLCLSCVCRVFVLCSYCGRLVLLVCLCSSCFVVVLCVSCVCLEFILCVILCFSCVCLVLVLCVSCVLFFRDWLALVL